VHQLDEPDVQFWLFTTAPYGPASPRNSGWGMFLLGVLVLYLGTVLFGIATWRAGGLPRPGALLLMSWLPAGILAALVLVLLGLRGDAVLAIVMAGLLGSGWVILGYALWSNRRPAVAHA